MLQVSIANYRFMFTMATLAFVKRIWTLKSIRLHDSLPANLFHQYRTLVTMGSKKALLLLTEGAEEMETVITADVLRRAQVCFVHYLTFGFSFSMPRSM